MYIGMAATHERADQPSSQKNTVNQRVGLFILHDFSAVSDDATLEAKFRAESHFTHCPCGATL
jgi:hypothetical protein